VHGNEFLNYDDNTYITENAHVLHGLNWPDVKWAFTTGHSGYAHPVTWLSHQLDCQLYGAWSGGHHLTNLAIHVVNVLLLYLFFWRSTRDLWPSAFVAALFAIHPLHVESVAWIAERKDVLSGLFFMLTLHAYAAYATKPQLSRYLLALGLFVLGILSKPMLVTVPGALLLLDYWPLGRLALRPSKRAPAVWPRIGWLIAEKIPFALVAAGWSVLTFVLQKEVGAVGQQETALRMANAIVSYATYLWTTFWPQHLAVFYPYPLAVPLSMVLVSAAVIVLVSVLCIARLRSSPYLSVGWFWYLGMLLPVIGLIQAGSQAHADRYTYLPQIGLAVALGWGIAELTKSWPSRRYWLPGTVTVLMALLMARTWSQIKVWHDSESLWNHALAVTPDNLVARYNLGHVVGQQGRYEEAVEHFTRALQIKPDFFDALLNMGLTLSDEGRPAEAIRYYHEALEVEPGSAKAHMQLGLVLIKTGEKDDAIEQLRRAQELSPNDPDIHTNLGLMLAQQGKLQESADQLNEALRLNPESAEAHNNLGLVFLAAGKPSEALIHFSTALRLNPDLTVARENIKRAQTQIGGTGR
jgi:tetratricopeptide (TPR) repeat protein